MRYRKIARPALFAAALMASVVRAAEPGIAVVGNGEATGKPTSVELTATVSAEAELTADAMVKFSDARKKAIAALEGLKLAGLTIEPGGLSVSAAVDSQSQMRMMNGMATPAKAPKTRVAEDLKVVIRGIDALKPADLTSAVMQVIDTGRDAGLSVGPKTPQNYYEAQTMRGFESSAMAQFRLDDADAVREKAYGSAMQDARGKAEKLAALAGVKLGSVVSVQDGSNQAANAGNIREAIIEATTGAAPTKSATAVSGRLADVSVKVTVAVQFAIEK